MALTSKSSPNNSNSRLGVCSLGSASHSGSTGRSESHCGTLGISKDCPTWSIVDWGRHLVYDALFVKWFTKFWPKATKWSSIVDLIRMCLRIIRAIGRSTKKRLLFWILGAWVMKGSRNLYTWWRWGIWPGQQVSSSGWQAFFCCCRFLFGDVARTKMGWEKVWESPRIGMLRWT